MFKVPPTGMVFISHETFSYKGEQEKGISAIKSKHFSKLSKFFNSPASKAKHAKYGSLQLFALHDEVAENYSSEKYSVFEAQKIAVLDIRICNTDRNEGNILLRFHNENDIELIPIDHGMCLPSLLEFNDLDFCWYSWPQIEQPIDERIKKIVMQIDINNDISMLTKNFHFRHVCLRNMKCMNILLKEGVMQGVTLKQIAELFCRTDYDDAKKSILEKVVEESERNARNMRDVKRTLDIRKEAQKKRKKSIETTFDAPLPKRDRFASMDATLFEEEKKVPVLKYEVNKIEEESSESDGSNDRNQNIEWTNAAESMSYHPITRAVSVQHLKQKKEETKKTTIFIPNDEEEKWLLYNEDFYYYFSRRITDEIQKLKK